MINDAQIEYDELKREHERLKRAYASLKADYLRLEGNSSLREESDYKETERVEIVLPAASFITKEVVAGEVLGSLIQALRKAGIKDLPLPPPPQTDKP
jgi:hypothetical protein